MFLGRTATPEFGLKAVTESELWGPSRNPWQTECTPGGSSGGSGAAVAAGVVPMAGANDGGGSIRIPAAYNGLFGLKPSRGRISSGPLVGEAWTGASSDHVVSRTVRDSAAMLDVLSGSAPGDPFEIPAPEGRYRDLIQQSPGTLKIGVFTASPTGPRWHPTASPQWKPRRGCWKIWVTRWNTPARITTAWRWPAVTSGSTLARCLR